MITNVKFNKSWYIRLNHYLREDDLDILVFCFGVPAVVVGGIAVGSAVASATMVLFGVLAGLIIAILPVLFFNFYKLAAVEALSDYEYVQYSNGDSWSSRYVSERGVAKRYYELNAADRKRFPNDIIKTLGSNMHADNKREILFSMNDALNEIDKLNKAKAQAAAQNNISVSELVDRIKAEREGIKAERGAYEELG